MGTKSSAKLYDAIKLVVKSLKDLNEYGGSSMMAIKDHIAEKYKPDPYVLSQIPAVLKKGVALGALKNNQGFYELDASMARQHRRRRKKTESGKRKRRRSRRRRRRKSRLVA